MVLLAITGGDEQSGEVTQAEERKRENRNPSVDGPS